MNFLIIGCGRVGSTIANALYIDNHDIVIVDHKKSAFSRLSKGFTGKTIVGHAFDKDVLENAGIEHADALAALTNGDNTNIVTAKIARDEYSVPKVVARIYDPVRARIYRGLGVQTVAPVAWTSSKIKDLLVHPEYATQLTFGNGEVEMTRVEITGRLIGKSVSDVTIPAQVQVSSITRLGTAFIPTSGTIFEKSDVVRFVVARAALAKFQEFIQGG